MILPIRPDRPPCDISRPFLVVNTPVLDRDQPYCQAGSTLVMLTWYLASTGCQVDAAWARYRHALGGTN